MKNTLKISDGQIIMDRTFAKNAQNTRSEEYSHLQAVRRDYPNYVVVTHQIKKNPSKESYRGLTYDYIERYIASHADAEAISKEYKELRIIAECHSIRFPTIKKWFLNKYPEISAYGLPADEIGTAKIEDISNSMSAETPAA